MAKKRQKIVETERYKVSENQSSPHRTRATQAAVQAAKEGAGDRTAGSTAPMAVLSQYDSSDTESGDEDEGPNGEKAAEGDILFDGLDDKKPAKGALGPGPGGQHTPDPTKRPEPPSRGPRSKRPRTTRSTRTSKPGRAGTRSTKPRQAKARRARRPGRAGTGSAMAWPGLKPPWPYPGQRPRILRRKHGPTEPPWKRWPPSMRRCAA